MTKYLKLNIQMFAISASNDTSLTAPASSSYKYTLSVSFTENSTNTANNTSNITCSASIGANHISYSVSGGGTLNVYWYDNNNNSNGTLIAYETFDSAGMSYGTKSVSGTINAVHNSDGSLSGYARAWFTKNKSNNYIPASGGVNTSNTTLTSIPRASSIDSVTTANIGSNPTIKIKSAVSGFSHKLYYTYGNISKTLITSSGLTGNTTINYSGWTIPASGTYNFYTRTATNETSGTGTLTLETYSSTTQNSSTYIGQSTKSFTVTVPSSAKPNISNPTIVDTDTVSKNTIQAYVVGKSKLQFTFPAFSSNYNSTLKNYVLKINGSQVYSGTQTSYTMSNTIAGTSNNYELLIYDARNNYNTTGTVNFTAYPYTGPRATISAGRDSTTDTTVNIKISGTITNINDNNRNAKTFKVEYKPSTQPDSEYANHVIATLTNEYVKDNVSVGPVTGLDNSTSYTFRVTAIDSYGSSFSLAEVGTSATLMNFSADGTAIAFGKASEKASTFECSLKSEFQNTSEFKNTLNVTNKNNLKLNGTSILQLVYPVGAIYISTVETNPATLFGFGTWEPINNKFLLAGSSGTYPYGNTGGSTSYTPAGTVGSHTLTVNEMPEHDHAPSDQGNNWVPASTSMSRNAVRSGSTSINGYAVTADGGTSGWKWGASGKRGGGKGHNHGFTGTATTIIPPYLSVYMWKRTA